MKLQELQKLNGWGTSDALLKKEFKAERYSSEIE
jgi:hypothetical protein